MTKKKEPAHASRQLRGWKEIAEYMGQPVVVAQRWGRSGMPVGREGRYVVADEEELSRWLGREAHLSDAAHITSKTSDLVSDLRESLRASRRKRRAA